MWTPQPASTERVRGADGLAGPASCAPRCWGCLRVSSRWELKGEHFNVTLFVRFGAFVEMGVIITGGEPTRDSEAVRVYVCAAADGRS